MKQRATKTLVGSRLETALSFEPTIAEDIKMKKDQVKDRVLQAVIAAEVSKGHLKWKVSDLARFTKVSRPLIYYHFGKTKKAILLECLNVIAEDYYGLGPDRTKSLDPESIFDSLMRTREMYLKNPSLVVFYHRARMQDSEPGRHLALIEERYQAKLKQNFPALSNDQIIGLHSLLHGMITAPFLDRESLRAALDLVSLKVSRAKR